MVENYRYLFKFQEERMKLVALVLVLAVTSNSMALMAGQTADTTNQTPGSKNAAKVKAEVQKRGIGKQAQRKGDITERDRGKGLRESD